MTVSTTATEATFSSGSELAIPFPFLDNDHIVVTRTDGVTEETLDEGDDYTLTGAGSPSGGTCTLEVEIDHSHTVTVRRTVPYTQTLDMRNQGRFVPEDLEAAMDLAMMAAQQLSQADTDLSTALSQTDSELTSTAEGLDTRVGALEAYLEDTLGSVEEYIDSIIAALGADIDENYIAPQIWTIAGVDDQQTYDLAGAQTPAAELYIVTVDGTLRTPGTDYTVSADDEEIIFTAPTFAGGESIVVRCWAYARATSIEAGTTLAPIEDGNAFTVADLFQQGAIHAEWFAGLDATGATACNETIQAAIDWAADLGVGKVVLPSGYFLCDDTITVPSSIELIGSGADSIGSKLTSLIASNSIPSGAPLLQTNPGCAARRMLLNLGVAAEVGIDPGTGYAVFEEVKVSYGADAGVGIDLSGASHITFRDCRIDVNGVALVASADTPCSHVIFDNCEVSGVVGVQYAAGQITYRACRLSGMNVSAAVPLLRLREATSGVATSVILDHCGLTISGTYPSLVYLAGNTSAYARDCTFDGADVTNQAGFECDSTAARLLTVERCDFADLPRPIYNYNAAQGTVRDNTHDQNALMVAPVAIPAGSGVLALALSHGTTALVQRSDLVVDTTTALEPVIRVAEAFNGSAPTVKVEVYNATANTTLMATGDSDLSKPGQYAPDEETYLFAAYPGPIQVTLAPDSSTTGEATVLVKWHKPDTNFHDFTPA